MLLVGGVNIALTAEYFVSPNGSASGDGSKAKPLNLVTVLTGSIAKPGDTFWLTGGTHSLGYVSTKLQGAAGNPVTLRAVPGQRATVDGSITHWSSAGYVDFWGLEWTCSDPKRISTQTGFYPTDIAKHNGFNTSVPYVRMINLVIHDQIGAGVYLSPETVGSEIHGCLAYNNGYVTADVSDGHGFYIKNNGVQKTLSDNIAINGIASGFHIYTEGVDTLKNIVLDGNVAFNAGIYSPSRGYRDLLLGGDGGQVVVDGITVQNTYLYYKPGSKATVLGQAMIGRDGINGPLTLVSNHFTAGLLIKNWSRGSVIGNRICNAGCLVDSYQDLVSGAALAWDGNSYQSHDGAATPFRLTKTSAQNLSYTAWKQQTGFDAASALAAGNCSGVECFIRPNKYEPGRANIIVYNWAKQAAVAVDVASVLPYGTAYEVRNAQDFFAAPVLSGVYQGEALTLPMNGLTVAKPNGSFTATAPTGPEFNVFILCPLPSGTPDTVSAKSAVSTTFTGSTLLANDTKLRAPLTLTTVSPASAKGGSLTLSSGQITYVSAAGFSGTDTFTYTVADALGSVGTGLVTVNVSAGMVAPSLAWSKPGAIVYGQALTTTQLSPTASVPGTFSFIPAPGTVLHAGAAQTLTATFAPADPAKYSSATIATTVDVLPAPLSVSANSKTMVYGSALPALTVTYSGFVNGDTAANLTKPAAATTTATSASGVGAYAITASGVSSSDYTPAYPSGALTITTAPLVITAQDASRVYGAALPTFAASYAGFVNGDSAQVLRTPVIFLTASSRSGVGQYDIVPSGATAANYQIQFISGHLAVTPAPLQILVNNATMTVGAALPGFTAICQGFVNGDTATALAVAPVFSTTAASSSPAGTYPITAAGASATNYAITYSSGVLTITSSAFVGQCSFTNAAALSIPVQGVASPYPAPIAVSGMGGTVSKVTVQLKGLSHSSVADVSAVLVSPNGCALKLFSYVGLHADQTSLTWTFDDTAAGCLPASGSLISGTYRPTALGSAASLPAPAPPAPYATNLAVFNGSSPNGAWSLYVVDMFPGDQGSIANGWVLTLTTTGTGGGAALAAQVISFSGSPDTGNVDATSANGSAGFVGDLYAVPLSSRDVLEVSNDGFCWQLVETQGNQFWRDPESATATSRLYRVTSAGKSAIITGFVRYALPANDFVVMTSPFGSLDGDQLFTLLPEAAQAYVFDSQTAALTMYTKTCDGWKSDRGGAPSLSPGQALFVKNSASRPIEVVISGIVPPSTGAIVLSAGYHLVANPNATAGLVEHQLGLTVIPGSTFYRYRQGTYAVYHRELQGWDPEEPLVGLGEGFFLKIPRPVSWSPRNDR